MEGVLPLGEGLRRRRTGAEEDSAGGPSSAEEGRGERDANAVRDVAVESEAERADVNGGSAKRGEGQSEARRAAAMATEEPEASAFECNVCFDLPRDPVVTSCGHLYCWPCIYKWMRVAQNSRSAMCCPVCKSGIEKSTIIPIYGRGNPDQLDPREQPVEDLPPRPAAQRTEATTHGMPGGFPNGAYFGSPFGRFPPFDSSAAGGNYGTFSFTAFGLFPSVFGMHMSYPPTSNRAHATETSGGSYSRATASDPSVPSSSQQPNSSAAPLSSRRERSTFAGSAHGFHRADLTSDQQNQEFLSRVLLLAALFLIFFLLFC